MDPQKGLLGTKGRCRGSQPGNVTATRITASTQPAVPGEWSMEGGCITMPRRRTACILTALQSRNACGKGPAASEAF